MDPVKIGVIGGTGIYKIEDLKDTREVDIDTPFGKPSDINNYRQFEWNRSRLPAAAWQRSYHFAI
jgi:purine nucleoside phosphorylase